MARNPRTTKKPIPRTRAGWENEVMGVRRFLSELETMDADLLSGWPSKQRAYYQTRLDDLLAHPPRGAMRPVR